MTTPERTAPGAHPTLLSRWAMPLAFAVAFTAAATAQGQGTTNPENGDAAVNADRFSGTYWAQIYPNRDYDRGCAIGFLAFEFQPTGYFIFNRKVTGSWQVDKLGNLRLRTKQGQRLTLLVHSDTLQATTDLGLIKRANLYQRCPS